MNRSLVPREHGAYAELGFPLLTGVVLGSPGAAAWLFVAAAVALFLAHEPLLVLLGGRGQRQQRELAAPARRNLFVLSALGMVAGAAALWLSPPMARLLSLVPAAFGLALLPVALARRLKSLPAEVVVAAAFSAMHLPVAAASAVTGLLLWGPAAMWFVVTVVATLCVHAIKARITGAGAWTVPASGWAAPLALIAALLVAFWVPAWRPVALAACVPLAGIAVVDRLALSPRKLRHVGWTVVAANAVAVVLLALAR